MEDELLLELLDTQDMGQKYSEKMIALHKKNMFAGQDDYLTMYLVDKFRNADDLDDFKRDMDYAIESLGRLRNKLVDKMTEKA